MSIFFNYYFWNADIHNENHVRIGSQSGIHRFFKFMNKRKQYEILSDNIRKYHKIKQGKDFVLVNIKSFNKI